MGHLRSIWAYRGFILGSAKREFQVRYRNSLLGAAWTVLNPLAMILVYTLIFSQVMRARLPAAGGQFAYSIYLCAGILTWSLFAEIVGRAQNVFLEHANLLKKLNFPRSCLPVLVVVNASINFAIAFGLFTVFLVVTGNFPGWCYFAVVPVLLLQIAFAIGLGVALGTLNVFFRDVGQFFTIVLQFWFWLTPIVYSPSILPEAIRPWVDLNPMARLTAAHQDILLAGTLPDWLSLWPVAVLDLVLLAAGFLLFRRHSGALVDEL